MKEIIDCNSGAKVSITIHEGNNPGCKEREDIHCPDCKELLHSGIYNDALNEGDDLNYEPMIKIIEELL